MLNFMLKWRSHFIWGNSSQRRPNCHWQPQLLENHRAAPVARKSVYSICYSCGERLLAVSGPGANSLESA